MGKPEAQKLITPRRNFLIRALGFTAAGATLPISIITVDDAKARMEHHQRELEKAWRDYYGAEYNVRTVDQVFPLGTTTEHGGEQFRQTSIYVICSRGLGGI